LWVAKRSGTLGKSQASWDYSQKLKDFNLWQHHSSGQIPSDPGNASKDPKSSFLGYQGSQLTGAWNSLSLMCLLSDLRELGVCGIELITLGCFVSACSETSSDRIFESLLGGVRISVPFPVTVVTCDFRFQMLFRPN